MGAWANKTALGCIRFTSWFVVEAADFGVQGFEKFTELVALFVAERGKNRFVVFGERFQRGLGEPLAFRRHCREMLTPVTRIYRNMQQALADHQLDLSADAGFGLPEVGGNIALL